MSDISFAVDYFGTEEPPHHEAPDRIETSEYVFTGWRFNAATYGVIAGETITWSLGAGNYAGRTSFIGSVTALGFDAAGVIGQALDAWAAVADLEFVRVDDGASVDIRFGTTSIDGRYNVLAHTITAYSGPLALYSDIAFDTGEVWSATGAGTPISFFLVALHEIGHALGLDHEDDVAAVMGTYLNEALTGLTADDIAGIQKLYGPPDSAGQPALPVPVPSAPPVPPPSATPGVGGFNPGASLGGYVGLISDHFYFSRYNDVAIAGIHPVDHYALFGWREGRNPNKLFDTNFYLGFNGDVAAAAINPLEHYANFGWREGRDPGPGFDVQRYLDANPDVKLVGIDPLMHYLTFGEAEGRQIFAAA